MAKPIRCVPVPENPKVAVVVATRNADLLAHHLESHELYTPADVPVVVVDTSSLADDEVRALVEDHDFEREVVYLDRRLEPGFYGNFVNAGIRAAAEGFATFGKPEVEPGQVLIDGRGKPDLIVLANDDTVVSPDWLPTMIADWRELEATQEEPVGLLGARSNYVSGPQSVFDRTLLPWGITGETVFAFPRIVTFFAMARLDTMLRAGDPDPAKRGGFDEALPSSNHSDDVLSLRMLGLGAMNWVSRAFVFHAGSQTFRRNLTDANEAADAYRKDMARGEEYVLEKYPDAPSLWGAVIERFYPSTPRG